MNETSAEYITNSPLGSQIRFKSDTPPLVEVDATGVLSIPSMNIKCALPEVYERSCIHAQCSCGECVITVPFIADPEHDILEFTFQKDEQNK